MKNLGSAVSGLGGIISFAAALLFLSNAGPAQSWSWIEAAEGPGATLQPVPPDEVPESGNFWSRQHPNDPPLPFNPFPGLPVYDLGQENSYLIDDSSVDFAALAQEREAARVLRRLEWELGLLSDAEYFALEGGNGPIVLYDYSASDLWIEILAVTNETVFLTLHGTVADEHYQLLGQTNLATADEWHLGEIITGAADTNQTDFTPLDVAGRTNQFFRAHHANPIVSVYAGGAGYEGNAIVPAGQPGTFYIQCSTPDALTVYYRMSGVASNGVDYTLLSGVVSVAANSFGTTVEFSPITDTALEGSETIIMTLVQTNGYLIQPAQVSATNLIHDAANWVSVFSADGAVEADGPPGVGATAGIFQLIRRDDLGLNLPLTVSYTLSGTAINGTDYTNLSGTVTFGQDESQTNVFIQPISDTFVEGAETVTLTLTPTNTYLIEPTAAAGTNNIVDTTTTVEVVSDGDAIEPHPTSDVPKQTGKFLITRNDTRDELRALTVTYQLIGTATNNIDYTNMTGTVTIPAGDPNVSVFIEPKFDDLLEGDETVTLTLTMIGDGYLINPGFASAFLTIQDNAGSNVIQTVTHIHHAAGIDYHQPTDSLIVSTNQPDGDPRNFARLFTTLIGSNRVTVITNWSGVSGEPEEVKLVTVKTTGSGFTNGDLFFGSGTGIGWVSPNATSSNLNWCVLTNSVQTNALLLRGSLCMDETGMFSNQVIAVTSEGGAAPGTKKGGWRVDANRNPTLLANIDTSHLEGVIVLTNDAAKWGPWAGKIITGDEEQSPPPIYTIATNGVVTTNDTTLMIAGGIHTEDFEIIRPGQDFYACDLFRNLVLKVSRDYFTNYIGQLLITEGADFGNSVGEAKLFVVRWDAATTNFVTRKILTFPSALEHVTFAPVNLPPLTP